MRNYIASILTLLCLLACGGEPITEAEAEAQADELLLADAEQAVTARPGYGFVTTGSPSEGRQCLAPASAPASQNCVYAPIRVVSFRCGTGFSGANLTLCNTLVDQEVQALQSQFPDWEFGRLDSNESVEIRRGSFGATSTTSIDTYISLSATQQAALTEQVAVNGTYRKYSKLVVTVDWQAIDANFTGSSILRNKAHTIGAATAFGVGLGLSTNHTTRKNSVSITAAAKNAEFTTADKCRVNAYDPSGNSLQILGAC